MKLKILFYFLNIIIVILFFEFTFASIEIPSFISPKKIIIIDNLNKMNSAYGLKCNLESIGYGIFFNYNSNISLIPINLFTSIKSFFKSYDDIYSQTKYYENGTQEFIIYANLQYGFETIHFIFENFGISIPLKYFLVEKEETEKYGIRFLTSENQENITFGKDLIDLMDIEYKDENNIIINNEEFISKMND